MRNCQEGKVKSREMEHSEETRQLVSIQSEKVPEVENMKNQMGSKHKSQSGIQMPWSSQKLQWKLKDSEVTPSNYWRKQVFQKEFCTQQNYQMSI